MFVGERVKIVGCSRYKFTRPARLIGKEGTIASYVGHSPGLVVRFDDGEQDAFYKDELELVSAGQAAGGVMAKTCRTCNQIVMKPLCDYWDRPFCYTRDCPHWSQRETPLLVDALEEALKELLDESVLYEIAQQANTFPNEPIVNLVENIAPKVIPALARYKEEVGDA